MERSANAHNINRAGAFYVSAVALTLLWFAALSSEAMRRHAVEPAPKAAKAAAAVAQKSPARHTVYPYSVVAGGVHSAADLRGALAKDPVVAAHYSDFRARDARTVTLPAGKMAYVSFRVRNEVYWTGKKILLPKGEQVITDGDHYARTRCGNRISDVPQPHTMPNQPAELLTDISGGELTFPEESAPDESVPQWNPRPPSAATPVADFPVGNSEDYPPEAPLLRAPSGGMGILAPPSPGGSAPDSPNVFPPGRTMPPTETPGLQVPAPEMMPPVGTYFATSPDTLATPPTSSVLYTPPVGAIQVPENRSSATPPVVVSPLTPLYPVQVTAPTNLVHPSAPIAIPTPSPSVPPSAISATAATVPDIVPADFTKPADTPRAMPTAPIVTPEPGTLLLFASALSAILCWRLRMRQVDARPALVDH